ncbi:Membrane dipeptidase (Peptidase family M19) [Pseudomonas sp. THAF187a]|uniref:dipeptidase n=1 Tax=unclassified Pseudomonas TaxID=196821 RepID=UPI0012678FB2|nr:MULTISPECIES: membrane dipeptidase [unclassified Pseudomonas]QFT23615.1 Membrane dipeptidase (Peptidase family M19) [Pseudomonas sp. THAF187a]QFT43803.1 Membrane dipeptidase (Peptidase family M19) [Pseudomonas sp. THAF42]
MRKLLLALLLLVPLSALAVLGLPSLLDAKMNSVASPPPYSTSASAQELHQGLFVADLHDDALLWERDLLKRYDYGHSDLPRMLEGRLGLQVFSTVTKTPRGLNMESNGADSDNITLLAMAQRWPRETWSSLLQRALYQAQKLRDAAAGSDGRLVLIRSREDLAGFIAAWQQDPRRVAGLLATEGLQPIEGKLENIGVLYDAGFRIAGLTHFFDNEVGGSAHGLNKGGLTPLGRQVIARLEEKAMLVDLAHASRPLIDDVLAMSTRPVLVSHTGVEGTCPGTRNLSDKHIQAIAAKGGVIGIGYWSTAVCDTSVAAIVKAIRYTVDQVGVEHVALGSDFNGTVHTPFDVTGLAQITEGLQQAGFDDSAIAAIMGGNVQRLLLASLPEQ